jgi:hypothetical protein
MEACAALSPAVAFLGETARRRAVPHGHLAAGLPEGEGR